MATTKISATKSTSRAINYAEKRAVEKSGYNCDVDYAKGSFKATRELYNKTNGNQGHVVIQSFKPDEVTPEQCNALGLELAQKIAPNHQVAVYTHNDTEHIHNHIVINAIDIETGKKFNNNKKALHDIRQANDEICRAHGLSIPDKQAEMRYTQAEKGLIEKGRDSWKDDIRQALDTSQATNYDELAKELEPQGIEIARITKKTITYNHVDENKKVRGNRLGDDYDKGGLERGFERQIQLFAEQERRRKQEEREKQERRYERYADGIEVDWDNYRSNTDKKRTKRIERAKEAEQIARAEASRNRESRATPQQDSRQFDIKPERTGFEPEL